MTEALESWWAMGSCPIPDRSRFWRATMSMRQPLGALTFDYQYVVNPAYNSDRGPASIVALRLHAQF